MRRTYRRSVSNPDRASAQHKLLPLAMTVTSARIWCWWYRTYAPGDMVLEGVEAEAREAKKGLWADPEPVPLWKWRKVRC